MSDIHLYYKNVSSDVIGEENGITSEQFDRIASSSADAVREVNRQNKEGLTAYRGLPYNEEYSNQVKSAAKRVLDRGCENFVVLGIGGSALGNIALQTALNRYMYNIDEGQRRGPRLFVFDNVDPSQLESFIDWAGDWLDKTVFNVISKSGRTAETASQFMVIRKLLIDRLGAGSLKDHIVATTDAKAGTLRNIADIEGLDSLVVPDGVGGRFSVLSPVGLLSAAVCGIDIDELLAGAASMDEKVSSEDFYSNPAALNAGVNWHYYGRGKPMSVMMPYCYALKDMADWFRQLWAESLGKAKGLDGSDVFVGPTPIKALGTTDQHSQVQLYREGPNDKVFTLMEVKDFCSDLRISEGPDCAPELGYLSGAEMGDLLNSEKKATEYALAKSGRPSMTVFFDKVCERTVGQFIYFYEVTTSIAGELFGINTYDQPAVELGKEATFALMGREGYEDLADEIEPFKSIDDRYLI